MSLECGMDHINDMWDWQSNKDRINPSTKSGAKFQHESPAQKPVDVVPEIVKTNFIEAATWLTQNKRPEEWTPAEASTVKRGRMYFTQRAPKIDTRTPVTKTGLENFIPLTPPQPRANREALLAR